MNGLSSGQATTSYSEKRPEKVDRPARAVIFETARAPTKDHAEILGWVDFHEADKDTRQSPCWSPKHGVSKQELPQLESGRREYRQMRTTHPMKKTGVWDSAEGSEPTTHLETTCCREDTISDRLAVGQVLKLEDWSGKRTGVWSPVIWRESATSKTAHV